MLSLFLFGLGLTESMSLICHEAVDMSEQEVKDRTEQLSPYRTGQNRHNQILYWGLTCRE